MRVKSIFKPALGIGTELVYALALMATALAICLALSFKR